MLIKLVDIDISAYYRVLLSRAEAALEVFEERYSRTLAKSM